MNDIQKNDRKRLLKNLLEFLDTTPTEIAETLHVSLSVISKHISGVKRYYPCDIFLIENIFHIKIERYTRICH